MYASVHTDRTGRVFISEDHRASGWNGSAHLLLTEAVPLPKNARVVPLERDAEAFGRDGRMRAIGRDRLALAAILPRDHTRLLFPSYADDRSAAALAPLPYAALGATPAGDLVVAAAEHAATAPSAPAERDEAEIREALRSDPGNTLVRQLARCAREHECAVAHAALARAGELPVPVGAPPAERPAAFIDLRSGYPGAPKEPAALHPAAEEVARRVTDAVTRVSFGRACDGEPLLALREMETIVTLVRERRPAVDIHLETTGCAAPALRRLIDAGVSSITFRFASATPDMYRTIHRPMSHEWSDVRASIGVAAEREVAMTLALLVLPGVTDRAQEIDAVIGLIGDLPGGTIELRDLGADPVRALAAVSRARPLGVRALLDRLMEADHFSLDGGAGTAAHSRSRPRARTRD